MTETGDYYVMNAECDGITFIDEYGYIAGYVTVRSEALVEQEMMDAVAKLEELLSQDGTVDAIVGAITDVNEMLDTLTNAEGEGRLDLVEAANVAINQALEKLTKDLETAQNDLNGAIKDGDDALDVKIGNLNTALETAKSAYAAADKAMSDSMSAKITSAESAIVAAEARLFTTESAIAQLQTALQKSEENGEALKSEIEVLEAELTEADEKAKTAQIVTAVVASTALACNVGLAAVAILLESKKKLISTLFSGIFKK